MKTIIALALAAAFATPALADQYVKGHTRSDGTYVAPHYRSTPNNVVALGLWSLIAFAIRKYRA